MTIEEQNAYLESIISRVASIIRQTIRKQSRDDFEVSIRYIDMRNKIENERMDAIDLLLDHLESSINLIEARLL